MLLIKVLAGIHKIYFAQISLTTKVSRIKYLGNRVSKHKHLQVKGDETQEINEE